jgi:hypothetical protein
MLVMWQTTNSVFSHVVLCLCHVIRPSFLFTFFYTKKKSLILRLALANHSPFPDAAAREATGRPAGPAPSPPSAPRPARPAEPLRPPNPSAAPGRRRAFPPRAVVAAALACRLLPARAGAGPGSSGDGDTVGLRSISSSAFSFLVIESPTLLCFARIDRIPLFY